MRRSLGVFVVRELARHRRRRIPLVGVSRAALDARRAWGGGPRGHGGGPVLGHEGTFAAQDCFAFQHPGCPGEGGPDGGRLSRCRGGLVGGSER